MTLETLKSLKIKNYKCFLKENDYQGFDVLKKINIIIGKNNSGKSKILEFLKSYVEKNYKDSRLSRKNDLFLKKQLLEDEIKSVFTPHEQNRHIRFFAHLNHDNWAQAGAHLVGKIIECSDTQYNIPEHDLPIRTPQQIEAMQIKTKLLTENLKNPFFEYECLSVQAERDLKKEGVSFGSNHMETVSPNGERLTAMIVRCLQEEQGHPKGWQQFVEHDLLQNINAVLGPDLKFTRLDAKVDNGNNWELYLEEEHKGNIKLSDCGSGIKTIIFAMAILHMVPKFKTSKKFLYIFEELENNLHPSLLRKLLAHIRDHLALNPDNILFLTTHSSIPIDMFNNNPDAQILRAYNDGKASFIETVDTWTGRHNLIEELGVKASDVLQTNCVVWLEGPSDKIYLKKWIELFNHGDPLEEGLHYQCVFYGGSVLSRHTLETEQEDNDLVKMLRVNRNAIVIMDSDRSSTSDKLKLRVQRITQEAQVTKSFTWVTEGREIENYIPREIASQYFGTPVHFNKFDHFDKKYKAKKGVETFDKAAFATDLTLQNYYTKAALEGHLDLNSKMNEIISYIRRCNN